MSEFNDLIKKSGTATDEKEIHELVMRLSDLIDLHEENIELLHARASLYIKLQQPSRAINDFRQILQVKKDDKQALGQMQMLKNILTMSANDIYANPNTNLDPWFE